MSLHGHCERSEAIPPFQIAQPALSAAEGVASFPRNDTLLSAFVLVPQAGNCPPKSAIKRPDRDEVSLDSVRLIFYTPDDLRSMGRASRIELFLALVS